MWTGGGTVFGPTPRSYTFKVNRKARRAALRSALSLHAERESLAVFDACGVRRALDQAGASSLLDDWGAGRADPGRARRREAAAGKSFRNLAGVAVMPVEDAGVADLIGAASLLVSEAALPELRRARRRAMAAAPRTRGGRGALMDPRQVIIRPVVSEKTFVLAEAGKYTFRVHDRAHKTQIRQAIEQLFDVNVRGSHGVGQEQAQAPRPHLGAHTPVEEGDRAGRARATRSRSSEGWRRAE